MIEPQELEVAGYRGLVAPCVRYDVDGASGIALVLPGAARSGNRLGGTPARPDLHFTRALLQHAGLAVLEAWWDAGSAPRDDLDAWIATNADAVVDAATTRHAVRLLVGRSLGTRGLAALVAREPWTRTPAIWLAPLLGNACVRDALSRASSSYFVVGGSGDELFDVAFAETLQASGVEVVVLEGADHGLAVDDPIESGRLLTHVLRRMRAFVERVVPDV